MTEAEYHHIMYRNLTPEQLQRKREKAKQWIKDHRDLQAKMMKSYRKSENFKMLRRARERVGMGRASSIVEALRLLNADANLVAKFERLGR